MDGPNSVVVADVNGDDHEDFITANMNANTVSVRLGAGDGSFPGGSNYGVNAEPHSVAVGVLAGVGDDSPDLVAAGHADGVITVLEGVGDGSFVYSGTYILSDINGPEVVVLGEWGNDAGLDVAVSTAWSDVRILVNYDGKFGLTLGSACGAMPLGLASAQLEPGGWSELVTANGVNESTTMLWGGTSNWTYGAGKAPRGVATGDFDGDARPDVVTADSGSDTVTVLLNRSLSEGYPWFNVGYPLAGVDGDPLLTGLGNLQPGSAGHLRLSHAKSNARCALCASAGIAPTPFKGGYLWPTPVQLFFLGVASPQGEIVLPWSSWQAGLSGHSVFLQYIIDDHAAVHHIALSNALRYGRAVDSQSAERIG
jgi:hypothetical protein